MAEIEYFYSVHSGFAYLGSRRFMDIARAAGRGIRHRPFDLGPVIEAAGGGTFKQRSPAHRAYYFGREIERWAEYRNVPVIDYRPTHHDNGLALASGMLIAAIESGHRVDDFAHAILEAHWRDDANHADPDTLARLAAAAGLAPQPLLDAAMTDDIQAIFAANTREAIERSVFGSPIYFVDGDMFYGQDHLELVERALSRPFAGTWPKA